MQMLEVILSIIIIMTLTNTLLLVAIGLINRLTNQQGDTRGACAKCGYCEL